MHGQVFASLALNWSSLLKIRSRTYSGDPSLCYLKNFLVAGKGGIDTGVFILMIASLPRINDGGEGAFCSWWLLSFMALVQMDSLSSSVKMPKCLLYAFLQ